MNRIDKYLKATPIINSDYEMVSKKASEIVANCKNDVENARNLFEYVRDEIIYNFAPNIEKVEDLKASHTLKLGNGFCVQKATLFAALCRASGIPAKIGFQKIRSHKLYGEYIELLGSNEIDPHGLNSIYLNGKWIQLDCTLDRALVDRKGYVLVEFNPSKNALFPKYDLVGQRHFDILKKHGFYSDIPGRFIDDILEDFRKGDQAAWKALVHKTDGCY